MKKLLAFIMAAVMLLALTACGKKNGGNDDKPNGEGLSGDVTFMVIDSFNSDDNALQAATDAFMKANPNVHVTIEYVASTSIQEKFTTAALAGSGPDVIALDSAGWAVDAAAAGLLKPLDNELKPIADQFFEGPLNSGIYNGSYYSVPWYMNNEGLYYNKTILAAAGVENPPATWDELVDAIAKVKAAGYEGITMPYFFPSYYMYPFFYQAGCPIVDTTGAKPVSALMTDEGKAAWKYLCDLATTYDAYPESIKDATSWDSTYAPFMQGEVAFLFCGDWAYWSVEFNSEVDYGIAPMPAGKEAATLLGGYTLSINGNTKNYDAAWAYIQWLTAAEQSNVLESYGRISARIDTDTTELVKNYPHEATFVAQRESTMSRPSIINQSELDEMVSNAYKEVFLGTKDADTALADLDAKVSTVLHGLYS